MRNAFCLTLCLALALLAACSGALTPEEEAARWAKAYYDGLIAGDYDYFLAGKAGADSLPDGYREQLLTAYRQFVAQQQREHGGISEVRVASAKTDSVLSYTNVFLVLCFGDSTNEEVVIPMVRGEECWKMK